MEKTVDRLRSFVRYACRAENGNDGRSSEVISEIRSFEGKWISASTYYRFATSALLRVHKRCFSN